MTTGNVPIFKSSIRTLILFLILWSILRPEPAAAADWAVTVKIHEVLSLSDDDASGEDDLYCNGSMTPTIGTGILPSFPFSSKHKHIDDKNHIFPEWIFVSFVTGGANATVQIVLKTWDHDSLAGSDDHFDINPHPSQQDLVIAFTVGTQQLTIQNVAGFETPRCAAGPITLSGLDGDDRAKVVFSVSASLVGAATGDSDGDGLLDSWEICGLDTNDDGAVDVDLPGMGANPFRKDLFLEIDWMADIAHSHAPWLPALIGAWSELNKAPVTNPTIDVTPTPSGIALHVDVGTLYAGYNVDIDGRPPAEITVDSSGNLDLSGDGIPDIGNLGALGGGTAGEGNQVGEVAIMLPVGTDFFGPGSTFAGIKALNFNAVRNSVFRYCVFGHQYLNPAVNNGSSGLACPEPACNDFMVTLGTWSRQTLDVNRDGVPDVGAARLPGPGGLPVDGTIAEHLGTLLHEMGHTMSLGHGGGDGDNYKPNYLSVMNYHFQLDGVSFDPDGNLRDDPVGLDHDRDGVEDRRRFLYSTPALAKLDENALSEPAGIGNDSALTYYYDQTGTWQVGSGNAAIDWFFNDPTVDPLLVATENPVPVPVNINRDFDISGNDIFSELTGFDDHARIANGGLAFQAQAPGISRDELLKKRANTIRIVRIPDERDFVAESGALKRIDFEDLPLTTVVESQYAPAAVFLADASRRPAIIGPRDRGGIPTKSPKQSLMQHFRTGNPVPLVITFPQPQRLVGLFLGREGSANPSDTFAALKAFDVDGLPMGEVKREIPSSNSGITAFLAIGAIFANQPIAKVELRYGEAATHDRIQIDDLLVSETQSPGTKRPDFPKPPEFGDLKVTMNVQATVLQPHEGTEAEPGHQTLVPLPFPVTIAVDQSVHTTGFAITRKEGARPEFVAPNAITHQGSQVRFQHWTLNDTIFFPTGQTKIAPTFLSDGTLTAVYMR